MSWEVVGVLLAAAVAARVGDFFGGLHSFKISRQSAASCQVGLPWEVITPVLIGAVLAALMLGYLAGLWSFKVKSRWCPRCGATTSDLVREHVGHAR